MTLQCAHQFAKEKVTLVQNLNVKKSIIYDQVHDVTIAFFLHWTPGESPGLTKRE